MEAIRFRVCSDRIAVCKLPAGARPEVTPGVMWCHVVTEAESSLVCGEDQVPSDAVAIERNWRCLAVEGPLEFGLKGILAGMLGALSAAGVSVFVVSTFETDHILVKEYDVEKAVSALVASGHLRQ